MLHEELTKEIIGAAMKVHSALRPGLDEKLYENALVIELKQQGYNIEQQKRFPVYYDSNEIGVLIPDLLVDDKVIVDTKVVSEFNEAHIAQMIGYLTITNLQVALLLNFKHASLSWKRVVK